MTRRQLIGIAPIVAGVAILASLGRLPFEWGHSLTERCKWAERPSVGFLGPTEPDVGALRTEFACWQHHGAKTPDWRTVKEIVGKWPSPAELTAWNGETNAH